jgi:hypothetical protein
MKKSKLGYKRYSPDVKKPYNVIPSGRITMKDVDFPVYGIDDLGYAQIMYPGIDYEFPGNQVFEIPMAQVGLNLPKPYIRSDFFTPRQIEEARYNEARKFATPASGRVEGEGLIDVVLPVVAAPIVKAIAKPLMKIMGDAASYAATQTPLRNAWRLNPKAYQYNLPENTMWRGLGQEGMDDAVSSGVFRSKQAVPVEYFPGSTFRASKSFGTNPYFTPKFKTAADYGDNFIAEVPIGVANWRNRYKNKPWSQIADKQIPIDEGKILQKDWLKGYKEIPKQLPGSPNAASSVDDVGRSVTNIEPIYRGVYINDEIRQLPKFKGKTDEEILDIMGTTIPGNTGTRRKKQLSETLNFGRDYDSALEHIGKHTDESSFQTLGNTKDLTSGKMYILKVQPDELPFISAEQQNKLYKETIDAWIKNNPNAGLFLGNDAKNLNLEILRQFGESPVYRTEGVNVIEGNFPQFIGKENTKIGKLLESKEVTRQDYLDYVENLRKTSKPLNKDIFKLKPISSVDDIGNLNFQKGGELEEFGSGGLKQWFAEKWVDVKTGKDCGRSGKDKDGRPYPACRPSRRVNSTTPKTTSEMSSSEKERFKREKTSSQRISYNHKRKQKGGQKSGSLGYDSMYNSPIASFRYMMNPKDQSKYYGEVYGTKQGPGIAAGLDYDNQKYGTQGMVRLGADPLRGASIRAQAGKRFNPIDNRKEDLSWGPYGGVNFQTNDYTEFTGTGNQLGYNNLRPRLTAGANAEYNRELANRGRFSIEGDLGVGVGNRYGSVGEFRPEPYGAVKATYSPPMYKNTRNKRPSPTTYSPRGYQLGGQMTPQGLTPAFFTGTKDAAVDAFKNLLSSSDQPMQPTQPEAVDWRKMKRPAQIKYGIDQVVNLELEDKRKALENLLESTAYMENKYGEDPNAYGRDYTSSFMSIDPIALKDMFTGRGDKGRYNNAQKAQFENFKKLGLPVTQDEFDSRLREDDPVAAMAAARFRYALVPDALPDMNNSKAMFDYWLKYYNGNGVLKHQSKEKAYKTFLKGYKLALGND